MQEKCSTTSSHLSSAQRPDEKTSSLISNISEPDDNSASKEYTYKQLQDFIKIPKIYKHDFRQHAFDKVSLSKAFLSICLLGVTGHGKSSTANTLSQSKYFKVSEGTESETEKVRGLVTTWQDGPEGRRIIVLDTPGFGDSKGLDTSHIANMVCQLKVIGYVHTFMLIFNSEDPRFDEQLQSTLKIFSQMFGAEYFKNVLICFTKFATNERAERERERGKKPTKERLIKDYKVWFKNIHSYSLNDDQFVFLNNDIFEDIAVEEREKEEHKNALRRIRKFTENHKDNPFYCKDIKEVMKEKDALQRKILQITDDAEKQRLIYIEEHDKKLKESVEKERAEAEKREQKLKKESEEREEECKKEAEKKEGEFKKNAAMMEKRIRKEAAEKERDKSEERKKEIEKLRKENEDKVRSQKEEMHEKSMHFINMLHQSMPGPNFNDISHISLQKPNNIFYSGDDDELHYRHDKQNKKKESNSSAAQVAAVQESIADVPRTKTGEPDMRYNVNRKIGYNKNNTADLRFKKNFKE